MDGMRSGGGAAAIATGNVVTPPRNGGPEAVGCAHMLCPEPATALLLFDARVTAAWLVDLEGKAWRGLPMCAAHANRFRPPVGWILSDQRSPSRRQRSGSEASPASEPAASVVESEDDSAAGEPAPAREPAPTPLLTRAFRTTAHSAI
ncbi:MAG: hypothetical protein OXG69_03355 [bacterium]|nr:hypothetical protein [bacterium]